MKVKRNRRKVHRKYPKGDEIRKKRALFRERAKRTLKERRYLFPTSLLASNYPPSH